jgi:hypothetical protein
MSDAIIEVKQLQCGYGERIQYVMSDDQFTFILVG